ncbi:MAG: TIGR03545 family protein [Pirellulales bacterium]
MIRWSYVFPRLLVIALITLVVVFAVDPLMRWTAITVGQRLTGAKVEVDELRSSLFATAVRIDHLQVADPEHTDRNLVEAETMTAQLDPAELLRRNWVVDRAHIGGLRVDATRATSGLLEPVPDEDDDSDAGDFLAGVGQRLEDALQGHVQQEIDALETVQLSRELMQRWPNEYQQMDERIDKLQQQVEELKTSYEKIRSNPLRALEGSQQILQQITLLHNAPKELRTEAHRLAQQVTADREALNQARERDLQRIRAKTQFQDLDTQRLVQYLVGEEWSGRIESLVYWVDAVRPWVEGAAAADATEASRGRQIDFPGLTQHPDYLIRSVRLDGEANIGRDRVPFAGIVTDVTTQPKLHGRPTVVKLQSTDDSDIKLLAIVDQTGDAAQSRVVIDCPRLPQPASTLGRGDQLAVDVGSGTAHLWAEVKLTGNALGGQILFRRDDVHLTPKVNPDYADKMLTDAWQTAWQEVDNLNATVDLSGTLTKPKWQITTKLGPQLAAGMKMALHKEFDARQQQLTDRAEAAIGEEMNRFTQLITSRQHDVMNELNVGEQELNELIQQLGRNSGLPTSEIGRKLQLNKLLKR